MTLVLRDGEKVHGIYRAHAAPFGPSGGNYLVVERATSNIGRVPYRPDTVVVAIPLGDVAQIINDQDSPQRDREEKANNG